MGRREGPVPSWLRAPTLRLRSWDDYAHDGVLIGFIRDVVMQHRAYLRDFTPFVESRFMEVATPPYDNTDWVGRVGRLEPDTAELVRDFVHGTPAFRFDAVLRELTTCAAYHFGPCVIIHERPAFLFRGVEVVFVLPYARTTIHLGGILEVSPSAAARFGMV